MNQFMGEPILNLTLVDSPLAYPKGPICPHASHASRSIPWLALCKATKGKGYSSMPLTHVDMEGQYKVGIWNAAMPTAPPGRCWPESRGQEEFSPCYLTSVHGLLKTGKDSWRLKPMQHLSMPRAGTAVCCDVLAHGTIQATEEMLPILRQKPGITLGEPLPASFLKHADEQTVAGLAAVLKAIQAHGLAVTRFTAWGVLAAPRFLGRLALRGHLQRFANEGAWGISPHLIPHRSLHSVSGTVSQALKVHGPNLGVGGGPSAAAEVILAAAMWLAGDHLPGVWVVLTGSDSEANPGFTKKSAADPVCNALALALVAARPGWSGWRLRLVPTGATENRFNSSKTGESPTLFGLESLLPAFTSQDSLPVALIYNLGSSRLELERPRLAMPSWETNGRAEAVTALMGGEMKPRELVRAERESKR